jgi:hypothetical protein
MNKGGRPKNQIGLKCKVCTKTYSVRRSMSDSKYCSYDCYWQSKIGKPSWNKGKEFPQLKGKKHFAWKGNKVSYRSLHKWVEREIGKPNKCTECEKVGYGHQMHWANISGLYKRDVADWQRLCAKCHKSYDMAKSISL